MVVYFSGTGNSRWCAKVLAEQLGDELRDSAGFIRHGIAAEFLTGRPWVFVCPTYAWRIPRVFEQFIRSGYFQGSREAYFLMTCGSDIGGAEEHLRSLCREVGLEFRGVLPVVMPENYIAMFDTPDAGESERLICGAEKTLAEAVRLIRAGETFPAVKAGMKDRRKSGVVNDGFYRLYVKAAPFRVTDACVGCGKCEELCPLGNIRLEDGRPVWGEHCTHCMACISYCPAEAIEYGKRSVGKRRYRCEDHRK